MKESLEEFLRKIPNLDGISAGDLISYLVYFLTIVENKPYATHKEIADCFDLAKIKQYSNIPLYLKRRSLPKKRGEKPLFISYQNGYVLERFKRDEIEKNLHLIPGIKETNKILEDLQKRVVDHNERDFLLEAIKCYNIDANRSSIIMLWILTISHLYDFIIIHSLARFNTALSKRTDKSLAGLIISTRDDLSKISEKDLIVLCESANIITKDVKKILEEKLGIRNSCAHPSGISISKSKAIEFIQDLVTNVILKYRI